MFGGLGVCVEVAVDAESATAVPPVSLKLRSAVAAKVGIEASTNNSPFEIANSELDAMIRIMNFGDFEIFMALVLGFLFYFHFQNKGMFTWPLLRHINEKPANFFRPRQGFFQPQHPDLRAGFHGEFL